MVKAKSKRAKMDSGEFIIKHRNAMAAIQREWEENNKLHKQFRGVTSGVRSSQLSALVAVIIKQPDLFCEGLSDKIVEYLEKMVETRGHTGVR